MTRLSSIWAIAITTEDERGEADGKIPEAPGISAAGNPIGFGRMPRKEDARFLRGQGITSMTSPCPGCCTRRSCAAPTRTPGSARSTPRPRPRRCPACMR